jgi:hypothetical protein
MSDKTDDSNFFWQTKYKTDTRYSDQLTDITDAYANELKMMISFMHVPSGKTVFFKAFITNYSEAFVSDWKGEKVYGRTDPIYTYGGTERKVQLSFDVPASSESEAYENMTRIQRLIQFQYPAYFSPGQLDEFNTEYVIGQSPLVRIKAMNLIQSRLRGESPGTGDGTNGVQPPMSDKARRQKLFDNYYSSPLPENGLLAAINNLSYNIEIGNAALFEKSQNTVMPQVFKVTIDFSAIHEKTIGFDENGNATNPEFPYGAAEYAFDPKLKITADASYGKRIQYERDNQAAADIAKSKYKGAFGNLRRKKDMKRGTRSDATDFDHAMANEARDAGGPVTTVYSTHFEGWGEESE